MASGLGFAAVFGKVKVCKLDPSAKPLAQRITPYTTRRHTTLGDPVKKWLRDNDGPEQARGARKKDSRQWAKRRVLSRRGK